MKYVKYFVRLSLFIFFAHHHAVSYSMEDTLRELRMRDEYNARLVVAAQAGDLYAIKKLLPDSQEKACVNALVGVEGATALVVASQNGHNETVEFLLEKKAAPNLATKSGYTALRQAALHRNRVIVQALLAAEADPNQNWEKSEQASPLFIASQEGDPHIVTTLLQARAHVNAKAELGGGIVTPLYIASQQGHSSCIETLLKNGAIHVINRGRSDNGVTPLMTAVSNGHYDAARILLRYGAKPRQKDIYQACAINYANSWQMEVLLKEYDESEEQMKDVLKWEEEEQKDELKEPKIDGHRQGNAVAQSKWWCVIS